MHVRARLLPVGLVAAAATLISATAAHASLLVASAANCPTESLTQAFLPWKDTNEYALLPGGKFSPGTASWTLSGGASVVSGGDGYSLGGTATTRSLSLPTGSSATSPSVCVGINNPSLRFVARNTGSATSTLAIGVEVETLLGGITTLPVGVLTASSTWGPTSVELIVANLLPLLPGNETPVAFTFTPSSGGQWQIDDVYVDPWARW